MNVAKSNVPVENLDLPDIENVLSKGSTASGKSSKKLSVERIYQKKTQLEHILLRPDTYVGSVDRTTQVHMILCIYISFPAVMLLLSLSAVFLFVRFNVCVICIKLHEVVWMILLLTPRLA